ncbi:phosphoribosylaminoimidazole carboxylase, putative [Actinidia rufa]|uniref:phosphoribosylaminoimidazole carboxylase n=1 Tax=Actinidia rufa TaxID=165716 RepID=A0A7J0GUY7_9ERIC|nr:phosphoribosylaminoimidazole carboxylase, putative [Actinidia rufa]
MCTIPFQRRHQIGRMIYLYMGWRRQLWVCWEEGNWVGCYVKLRPRWELRCDVVTVEIEHVDVATLVKLERQGINCQPKASTIRIIQDKYLQKVHFSSHAIPLPEFMQIDDPETAKRAGNLFGYPLMIKSKRLAYDGRGNAVAKSEEEISSAVKALGGYDRGLYVEQWAQFVKELAVIVARGQDDSILCYPVVETIHRENICHIVKAPANVPWNIRKLATDVAHKAVSSLEGAGVFSVELFLTKEDQILLNEVAPRPHNSGHHSIESCFTSQYEQHLRAVVGLQLGDPSMKTPAAIMYNILGEDEGEPGFLLAHQLIGRALGISGATVHWYDKPEMRRHRKMGHITIVGHSVGIVEARLKSMLGGEISDGQTAVSPRVGIIMGSDSDLPVMKDAARILNIFDVPYEVRIVSAHRTPELMFSYASSAGERGIQVIIAGAGGAAHLPGMVAAMTPLPVIGVPVRTSTLDGLDSLLSIVQVRVSGVGVYLGVGHLKTLKWRILGYESKFVHMCGDMLFYINVGSEFTKGEKKKSRIDTCGGPTAVQAAAFLTLARPPLLGLCVSMNWVVLDPFHYPVRLLALGFCPPGPSATEIGFKAVGGFDSRPQEMNMECKEPILTTWPSRYNIREELAELNANLPLTRVLAWKKLLIIFDIFKLLCPLRNESPFKTTNSFVANKQSAASSKCSISKVLRCRILQTST